MHPTGWGDAPVIDPLHRPFAFIYRPVQRFRNSDLLAHRPS
jgi:hypothetical protein